MAPPPIPGMGNGYPIPDDPVKRKAKNVLGDVIDFYVGGYFDRMERQPQLVPDPPVTQPPGGAVGGGPPPGKSGGVHHLYAGPLDPTLLVPLGAGVGAGVANNNAVNGVFPGDPKDQQDIIRGLQRFYEGLDPAKFAELANGYEQGTFKLTTSEDRIAFNNALARRIGTGDLQLFLNPVTGKFEYRGSILGSIFPPALAIGAGLVGAGAPAPPTTPQQGRLPSGFVTLGPDAAVAGGAWGIIGGIIYGGNQQGTTPPGIPVRPPTPPQIPGLPQDGPVQLPEGLFLANPADP